MRKSMASVVERRFELALDVVAALCSRAGGGVWRVATGGNEAIDVVRRRSLRIGCSSALHSDRKGGQSSWQRKRSGSGARTVAQRLEYAPLHPGIRCREGSGSLHVECS